MSAAPWTEEELIRWIAKGGVTVKDAHGYLKFVSDVADAWYSDAIIRGRLGTFNDFTEDVREAIKKLETMQ